MVSPVIANAFRDYVLDQGFVGGVRPHCHGYCNLLRYADDALAVFETEDDARRFLRVLPLRLGKFGLRLNTQKTHLVAFGKRLAWQVLGGWADAHCRLPRVHPRLGAEPAWEGATEAQNLEKASATGLGGAQSMAPAGTQRTHTPRPLAGERTEDARPLQLFWGDRQQPCALPL
jgi:Reverse transcriptase (RNA-dependent DNA polymerase)